MEVIIALEKAQVSILTLQTHLIWALSLQKDFQFMLLSCTLIRDL